MDHHLIHLHSHDTKSCPPAKQCAPASPSPKRCAGPDVEPALLRRLAEAFTGLRRMVDEGELSYPYSTRELVAVVKHLQAFPDDGAVPTLENVLAGGGVEGGGGGGGGGAEGL